MPRLNFVPCSCWHRYSTSASAIGFLHLALYSCRTVVMLIVIFGLLLRFVVVYASQLSALKSYPAVVRNVASAHRVHDPLPTGSGLLRQCGLIIFVGK